MLLVAVGNTAWATVIFYDKLWHEDRHTPNTHVVNLPADSQAMTHSQAPLHTEAVVFANVPVPPPAPFTPPGSNGNGNPPVNPGQSRNHVPTLVAEILPTIEVVEVVEPVTVPEPGSVGLLGAGLLVLGLLRRRSKA